MIARGAALLAIAAALPLTGAARKDPLAGYVAGPPVRCIDTSPTSGLTVLDEHTVVYRETGRRLWTSHPKGACPTLRPFTTLIVEFRTGTQLCENDRFRTRDPGDIISSPYCLFEPFTPYTKVPR